MFEFRGLHKNIIQLCHLI
uniref:Uncharacterized protein n=1 Tax=Arundo donax TaxID=35708 RepID=A0A0A8YS88_ARUDO